MNQHKSISLLICSAIMFFLISCGGSGNEEKSTTDTTTAKTDTTTATTATPQPSASAIVTTPQDMMVATHKVKDFDKWKASYDAHDSFRLANGIHSYVVARGAQDPSMVMVAVKVDDMKKAKAFAKDPSLKKAMQQGGVVGTPTFSFVTMVFQDTSNIGTDLLRSRSTFTVKDWDRWQKAFDSTRQLNTDNGLKLRAYGHDVDDNHKVVVVSAIIDTAKARAYFNSDLLKQRRAASGAGPLQRFIYHVVQRY
jgi:hypothetical protein